MKFLLTAINAKYIHSNLAVYSLRAASGAARPFVELAEFTINHRTEEILRELYGRQPDVLLFSCYIWNIVYVKELAAECRKVLPGTPIWVGGPEVSYDAEQFLADNPAVDGVLCGEGEDSFRQLAASYLAGQAGAEAFARIPGLTWRDGASGIRSNPPAALPDFDALPFPYEDLTEFDHRIIYYESSRGCPFSCSYCLSSIDKSVRFRDPAKVCRELQFFLDRRVAQVKFVDRTFNCRKGHALSIWRYLLEHDNGVTNFHFEIAADLLDEEELELIGRMRPGLIQLEIGVQSVNPRALAAVCRRTDLVKLRENVARVRAGGNVHQHLDLIAGLPYEDYESFGRSFDAVFAMRPEQLQLGFLKVLKGSQMCREAENYGVVRREQPPYEVLFTPWLSFSDILRLKTIEEMVEIYYNSLQFQWTLARLIPCFPSPFRFFERLAAWYGARQAGKASRQQKYELLLEFIREQAPGREAEFRELLTVDYYLRERAKARPSFAPDQSACQEEIREILRLRGRQKHVEALRACTPLTEHGAAGGQARTAGEGGPVFLVFDYEQRDPLTGNAHLEYV